MTDDNDLEFEIVGKGQRTFESLTPQEQADVSDSIASDGLACASDIRDAYGVSVEELRKLVLDGTLKAPAVEEEDLSGLAQIVRRVHLVVKHTPAELAHVRMVRQSIDAAMADVDLFVDSNPGTCPPTLVAETKERIVDHERQFMRSVVNLATSSTDCMRMLYNLRPGAVYSANDIERRARELYLIFHPDKLDSRCQVDSRAAIDRIQQWKAKLLDHANCIRSVDELRKEAMKRMEAAKDPSVSKEARTLYLHEAYRLLRNACVASDAGEVRDAVRDTELRILMATALHASDDLLGAQLFALGAQKYVMSRVDFESPSFARLFRESRALLDTIRNECTARAARAAEEAKKREQDAAAAAAKNDDNDAPPLPTTPPPPIVDERAKTLQLVVQDATPLAVATASVHDVVDSGDKLTRDVAKRHSAAISEVVSWDLLGGVVADGQVVRFSLSGDEEKRTKAMASYKKTVATTFALGGLSAGVGGAGIAVAQSLAAYNATMTVTETIWTYSYWYGWTAQTLSTTTGASMLSGSVLGVVGGTVLPIAMSSYLMYSTVKWWREVAATAQKSKTAREIVLRALDAFCIGKFTKCLTVLTESYGGEKPLIRFSPNDLSDWFDSNNLFETTLALGWQPDLVAFLVQTIATCLMSRLDANVRATPPARREQAMGLLNRLDTECTNADGLLLKAAVALDKQSSAFEKNNRMWRWISGSWRGMNDEFAEELRASPMTTRVSIFNTIGTVNRVLLLLMGDRGEEAQSLHARLRALPNLPDEIAGRYEQLSEFMQIFGIEKFVDEGEARAPAARADVNDESAMSNAPLFSFDDGGARGLCQIMRTEVGANSLFEALCFVPDAESLQLPLTRGDFSRRVADAMERGDAAWTRVTQELMLKRRDVEAWRVAFASGDEWPTDVHLQALALLCNCAIRVLHVRDASETLPALDLVRTIGGNAPLVVALCETELPRDGDFERRHYRLVLCRDGNAADPLTFALLQSHTAADLARQQKTAEAARCQSAANSALTPLLDAPSHAAVEVQCAWAASCCALGRFRDVLMRHDKLKKDKSPVAKSLTWLRLVSAALVGTGDFESSRMRQLSLQFPLAHRASPQSKEAWMRYVHNTRAMPLDQLAANRGKGRGRDVPTTVTGRVNETPWRIALSCDGGGTRGVIEAVVLREVEERIGAKKLAGVFDLVAGTSTGAIVAIGISKGRTATELLDIYLTRAREIFPSSGRPALVKNKYSDSGLVNVLTSYFGTDTLETCASEVLVPTFDMSLSTHTHFFTKATPDRYMKIVDVLRATTAAPTFFPEFTFGASTFVDGGVRLNNPAEAAARAALRKWNNASRTAVLSLGTGTYVPDPMTPNAFNGQLFWAQTIAEAALLGREYDEHVKLVDMHRSGHIGHYCRVQPMLPECIPLDAASDSKLRALFEVGEVAVELAYEDESNSFNRMLEICASKVQLF
jgi:predicted acylesterase/phospholipase RssA